VFRFKKIKNNKKSVLDDDNYNSNIINIWSLIAHCADSDWQWATRSRQRGMGNTDNGTLTLER